MAEDQTPPPQNQNAAPTLNLMLPVQQSPLAVYANAWQVQIGETEITVNFGIGVGSPEAGTIGINPVTSITLSHSRFAAMATEFQVLSSVLHNLYDGPMPIIKGLSKSRLDSAIAKVQEDNKRK